MIKRFNTLKSTPQILIAVALFGFVAILSILWGAILCIIALPALTFFNYTKGKSLIAKIVHSALSLVAECFALFPSLEIANAKAERAMQKAEKYKKEAKDYRKEAEGLRR